MKSKVTAIKFSFAIVLISLWIYIECQWDFYCSYLMLKTVGNVFKVFLKNGALYQIATGIYAYLLNMPGPGGTKIIEMVASGIFGSAIVTGLIYVVEYRVQLRENINSLIIREIYLKDITEIEQLTDEIYFLNMRKKSREKSKIVQEAIDFDKMSNILIKNGLEGFFECNDMKDSFRRSRKLLLEKIESLQENFYGKDLKEIESTKSFDKWCSDIKQNILKDKSKEMSFDKPKNKFMISNDGAAIPYEFSRKSRLQGWDYTIYLPFIQNEEYLKKMNYK